MGLKNWFKSKKEKNQPTAFNVTKSYLKPHQEERLALRCYNSIKEHLDEIEEAALESYDDPAPFTFESCMLMYMLTDMFIFEKGLSDICRDSLFKKIQSYCMPKYFTYLDSFGDNEPVTEAIKDRLNTYTSIIRGKNKPSALWAPYEFDDDLAHNLVSALGNYIYYAVYSSKVLVGDISHLPKLSLDAIDSFDFNSTMTEVFGIISGHSMFIDEAFMYEVALI